MLDDTSGYGSVLSAAQHNVEAPLSYSKSTRDSVGRQTAWKSTSGMALSKKNLGSTLNFDDSESTPAPKSDTGASFGGA